MFVISPSLFSDMTFENVDDNKNLTISLLTLGLELHAKERNVWFSGSDGRRPGWLANDWLLEPWHLLSSTNVLEQDTRPQIVRNIVSLD